MIYTIQIHNSSNLSENLQRLSLKFPPWMADFFAVWHISFTCPTPFEPDPREKPVRAATRPAKRCGAVLLLGMTNEAILPDLLSAPLWACVVIRSHTTREARE